MGLAGRWTPAPGRAGLAALVLACAAAATSGQVEDPAEVGVWIERLGSAEASVRERAERHLAAHLSPEDLAPLVRALRAGDAEVRRRLVDALAADPRRLGMAAFLAHEPRPELRAAGESALAQMIAAWCPSCGERGAGQEALERAVGEGLPSWARLPAGAEPPAAVLERLDRLAGLGLPIAIDPTVRELGPKPWPQADGDALGLLGGLLAIFDLDLEVFGLEGERVLDSSWVLVTRRGLARLAGGRALLVDAVRRVQGGGAEAPAAALLLAGCGWPAALGWLEERAWAGDGAAFDALLLAAGSGRVAPGLATPWGQARALARADRALAEGRAGARELAERTARGLAAAAPLGPRGEDLDAPLLASLPDTRARGGAAALWMRLVILEGRRGRSAAARAGLVELLGRPGLGPHLGLATLRALAAQVAPTEDAAAVPAAPAELESWVRAGVPRDAGLELARLAARLGWPVPRALAQDAGRDPELALLVADWLHAGGELEDGMAALVPHAAALEADPRLVARATAVLRGWVRREGASTTARLFEGHVEGGSSVDPLVRLLARAGLLGARRQGEILAEVRERGARPEEFAWVGHLAAGVGGVGARGLLLERLAQGNALSSSELESLQEGLTAAALALAGTRQDEALAIFLREVWRTVSAARDHPLRARLDPAGWPPRAAPPARTLGELERDLRDLAP